MHTHMHMHAHTDTGSKALNLSYKEIHKSRQPSVTTERPEDYSDPNRCACVYVSMCSCFRDLTR